MKYDKPLIAILIGIVAGLPAEIYTQILKFYHLTNISFTEIASMMYIKSGSMILGILSGTGLGAIGGLVTYYSAKILGTDYFPLKAMLIAMTFQSFVFIIFGTLGGNQQLVQDVAGNFAHASGAALAGLIAGYLMKKFLFK